ncbi:MAG: putative lactoylglutathione lyase [Glaciecola sp.]|jgi:predicted lactoylglutathione lyase
MVLGLLSISLKVADIAISKAFYEKLGFNQMAGHVDQKWVIMKDANDQVIGLFEGMLKKNMLTFNPGWDSNAQNIDDYIDVRYLQKMLIDKGIDCGQMIGENNKGPANFMLTDPDGNPILIDQHR